MKIAFVFHWPDGPDSGVSQKVLRQVACWREEGNDAGIFLVSPRLTDWAHFPSVVAAEQAPLNDVGPSAQAAIWRQQRKLIKSVESWQPDVIYHRQTIHYPGLRRAALRRPLIVEINGDDIVELRRAAPRKALLNQLTRGQYLSVASGFVSVSQEMAVSRAFAKYQRPTAVIANGIDLSGHEPLPVGQNLRPRLAFVGHDGLDWHGLDQLLLLAEVLPDFDFDVIGMAPPAGAVSPSNVTYHGPLFGDQLSSVLTRADVGIGTLALFRKGLNEASPLKSRLYLALGLPVITGYEDTDFPQGADFLARIPNREGAAAESAGIIADFVERWRGRRVPRSAIAHIDYRAKERRRLQFIRAIVTQRATSRDHPSSRWNVGARHR